MKYLRLAVAAVAASYVLVTATPARAQQYVVSGIAQAASGVEGGGGRGGSFGRAPTRLRVGAEVHVDEDPEDNVAASAVLDLEPQAAFGVDARYVRVFAEHYAASIGAIGYFTPGTLLGPTASFEARKALGKSIWLTAGPEVNVFFVGIALPDKTVLWQALLHVGLRLDL